MPDPHSPPDAADPTDGLSPGELYFNRERSWLDFNRRVLELAFDPAVPLLERVKYLAIFSSNLDEFFMKRVGGLQRQRDAGVTEKSLDGLTPTETLGLIHRAVRPMLEAHTACWYRDLHPALKKQGVAVRRYADLSPGQRAAADEFFRRQVFPILTPLAVDPGHPFPFISNLSKSIGVMLQHPATGEQSFVRVKMPENLPRWVPVPPNETAGADAAPRAFVPLEGVIGGNLGQLFLGMDVLEHHLFRVTRNADIEMDEEDADDLLALVEQELRRRRIARVVRLELPEAMGPAMRDLIVDGLDVDAEDVYTLPGPIDMDDLIGLYAIDRPDLKDRPWSPTVPPRLADDETDFFSAVRQGDLLVHHPYESFAESVERFVETAARDPKVLAIKMTLYRTSGDSPFVPALIKAAESGKQVAVLIELKARFDEQRNVELAQVLEKAGVHVVYGMVGLKTHTKLAMVVRDESDGLRAYCHIATGNYNSRTATLYTDLGLFTADAGLAGEVIELFHYLTGRSIKQHYDRLLVAPVNMREQFLAKIAREADHARAGRGGRIVAKMNALQDEKIIKALYRASAAGAQIDLIVRGFCCLRPGVPGLSDNIRVLSILGRFLEHSRIFHFANADDGDGTREEWYLGSADWMYRNLTHRVEAITPVTDPASRATLRDIFDAMLADRNHAWTLRPDGTWPRREPGDGDPLETDTHAILMRRAAKAAKR